MRNLHISDYDTAVLPGTVSFQLKLGTGETGRMMIRRLGNPTQ